MELDMRKLRILQAIIDDYILTAAPIGSRSVSKHSDIGLSSATIRNEMSDLEELGFLEQPHTSAGRIPSDKAYRLYVNDMMRRSMLTESERRYIKAHFNDTLDDMEEIFRQTAWVLSSVTKYTSMVLKPQLHAIKLKRIQLVQVDEDRALVVVVTDAGITRDSIIRIPRGMDAEQLMRLSSLLTERLANARLDEVTGVIMPELSLELGEQRQFLNTIAETLSRVSKKKTKSVELSGTNNMLSFPEYSDVDKARSLLCMMEEKDILYRMLTDATRVEFSITIGSENKEKDMQDCSVVTATYKVGDDPLGSIGVIGPTRMDYSRALAILGYMGKSLSDILTNLFEEERR